MDGHDDFPLFDSRPDWDLDHKMCLNGLLWQNKEDHTRRLCFYKSCRVRKEWFVYLLCLETCESERARGGVFEKQKSNCTLFEFPKWISNVSRQDHLVLSKRCEYVSGAF